MTARENTKSANRTARIIGALFLVAMVTSLVGAGLIEAVAGTPVDLVQVSENESQVAIGALLELINGICVVGIAVLLYPILKKHSEAIGMGYVGFRIIEATIIVAGAAIPLLMLGLSQEYLTATASEAAGLEALGATFNSVRAVVYGQMLGVFFGLAALPFYYSAYQTRLIPRFLSIWGLVAAALVLIWNVLELAGIHIEAGIIFGLPIILNEIVLGIWLIAKGFSASAVVSDPAGVALSGA